MHNRKRKQELTKLRHFDEIVNPNVMDDVISTTFIKRSSHTTSGKETLLVARNILLNRLFLGNFVERRYVDRIMDYRDVVKISAAESELICDLNNIRQKIYTDVGVKWVGITGPEFENAPNGYCLWVTLKNIPFGQFWFQIKQIKCENEEIIIKLHCVRPALLPNYELAYNDVKKNTEDDDKNSNNGSSEYVFKFDPAQILATLCIYLKEVVRGSRPHITLENLILVGRLIITVLILLVTAIITCVSYIGEYILRLIRELSILLQAVNPVLVQVVDCITKTIGGLFILIALAIKTRDTQELHSQFQPSSKFPALPDVPKRSPTFISRHTPQIQK